MRCSEADLARVACYLAKSDRYGKRIRNSSWTGLNKRLPCAALIDLFRLLSPYSLPELMIASREGTAIRQQLVYGPDRRRRDRRDERPAGDAGSPMARTTRSGRSGQLVTEWDDIDDDDDDGEDFEPYGRLKAMLARIHEANKQDHG